MFKLTNKIVTTFADLNVGDHFMLSDDSTSVRVKRAEFVWETQSKNCVSLRKGAFLSVADNTPVIEVDLDITVTEAK